MADKRPQVRPNRVCELSFAMPLQNLLVIVVIVVMVLAGLFLLLAWATTEANKQRERPFFERARPGRWAVQLLDPGRKRISAVRIIREGTGFSLRDSKALVDRAPSVIVHDVAREDAEELMQRFETIGAQAVVMPTAEVMAGRAYDPA